MPDGRTGEAGASAQPPRFAGAVLSTFGTRLAVAALSFVGILIVSRALGPTGRGEVALLLTIASVTAQLARLGVDEANANLAGSDPARIPALATNSLLLALVAAAGAVGLLVPLALTFPGLVGDIEWTLVVLALVAIPILIVQAYLTFIIRGAYGFTVTNVSWVLGPLGTVLVTAPLAAVGALTVGAAVGAWVVSHALAVAILAAYVVRRLGGFGRPDRGLAGAMLRFGLRAYLGRMLMAGNYRVDQWIVGGVAGTRELGLYSVAVAWAEVLFYLPTVLVVVQRPYLVRATRAEAAARAARIFRAGMLLTLPAAGVVIGAAPFLCEQIFGPEFAGAVDDLRVLAFGALGVVALEQLGNALTAQRRPGLATVAAGFAFGVTIALDLLLIPPLGGLGAAVASTAAYTVGGTAAALLFMRELDVRAPLLVPRPRDLRALVATGAQVLRRRPAAAGERR